jgi:hypothetical protein
VIEWVPTAREEVENVAVPELSVPLPMVVPPSRNVTVPVAVEGDTAAVNVTTCPERDGLRLDANVVLVLALVVWTRTAELLALSLPSPP